MHKTATMRRVEEEIGSPLEVVIPDMKAKGHSVLKIARTLGVHGSTIYRWFNWLEPDGLEDTNSPSVVEDMDSTYQLYGRCHLYLSWSILSTKTLPFFDHDYERIKALAERVEHGA